jgi:hypothetical protein
MFSATQWLQEWAAALSVPECSLVSLTLGETSMCDDTFWSGIAGTKRLRELHFEFQFEPSEVTSYSHPPPPFFLLVCVFFLLCLQLLSAQELEEMNEALQAGPQHSLRVLCMRDARPEIYVHRFKALISCTPCPTALESCILTNTVCLPSQTLITHRHMHGSTRPHLMLYLAPPNNRLTLVSGNAL